MSTCSRHAILGSVLDLHVEEIHVLPVSQFLLFMIPMLLKKHYAIEYLEPHQATGGGGEKGEAQHEDYLQN